MPHSVKRMTPSSYTSRLILALSISGNSELERCDYPGYCDPGAVDTPDIEAYLYLRRFAYRTRHGKGTETRPQTRSAGARRCTQSASRGHSRRLVRRQSLLRYTGSDSSALRDGATASRRWGRNQQNLHQFRRLAANFLQGPAGASKGRAAWPAAEPTRSQGWAQDLCRGGRLRGRSQSRKAQADNLAMSPGDRDTVWRQGPSAKFGARAGAQKKTNQSASTIAAASKVADAYESLRAAALSGEATASPGVGILRRQGLAAWMRALEHPPHPDGDHPMTAPSPASELPPSSQLTRLIASIIVSVGTEHAHA
jgi:hypothetical protein